jgi:hypothetical protein
LLSKCTFVVLFLQTQRAKGRLAFKEWKRQRILQHEVWKTSQVWKRKLMKFPNKGSSRGQTATAVNPRQNVPDVAAPQGMVIARK